MIGKKCIVRGKDSGVFYGELVSIDGTVAELKNYRKLYRWEGATAVEGLAMYGTKRPESCRFTLFVDAGTIFDMVQCIPCTDVAKTSIEGVKIWTI